MKIIDEKGKLFGKINLIDFLVILLMLCLVPAFFFGYKIFTKRSVIETLEREFVEIETNCQLIKLRPEALKTISVGDKELDENGQVIGEIISLGQSRPYIYEFDIGGEKIIKKDTDLKQIEAKLKLKVEVKKDNPYYKDEVIKIGSPFEFETNNFIFTAIPFEEEEEEERIIDLYVTLKDLDEDVLKKISVGDKEVDESGKTIAEILSLGKVENSSQAFDFGGNNVVIEKDRIKKQITTKMRLKCQVKDSRELYFKGVKVGENTSVKFKTNNYEVIGQVALKEKWVSLRVKFSGVPPEIAGLIQKGDTEKDPFDKITARMSSIISNEPSQNWVVTITDKDEFITRNRSFHRDIMVSLDVLCVEKKGAYYFKESRVKMGNKIIFETDSYSISGDILGMKMR